jgi:hypothetical protein
MAENCLRFHPERRPTFIKVLDLVDDVERKGDVKRRQGWPAGLRMYSKGEGRNLRMEDEKLEG